MTWGFVRLKRASGANKDTNFLKWGYRYPFADLHPPASRRTPHAASHTHPLRHHSKAMAHSRSCAMMSMFCGHTSSQRPHAMHALAKLPASTAAR